MEGVGATGAAEVAPTDGLNQASWADPETIRWFTRFEGWSDRGEEAAFTAIRDEIRGQPVLDLGIGAGRTTTLLRPLTDDYVGIDYLPQMVAAAQEKHPDLRIELGDARDLGRFADGSFGVVVFSWNGIDAVGHEDRRRILDEVARVLRPGGIFLYSTHNLDGPGYGQKPWGNGAQTLRHPRIALELLAHLPGNVRAYRRNRAYEEVHDGWAMRVAAAHGFGIVIHYTTLAAARAEAVQAGFAPDPAIFESDRGVRVAPNGASKAFWVHLVARKAG
jgi:SAM-dependent methyltransferase